MGGGDERTAKRRTGSTEQVDGGETELSGEMPVAGREMP